MTFKPTTQIYEYRRVYPPSTDPAAERLKQEQDIYKIFKWARDGNVKELKAVLDNGEDPNKRDFDEGNTPLHWACAKGQLDTIELLLQYGANPNAQNDELRTPLHVLIFNQYDKVLLWMIKEWGADPYIEDRKHRTVFDLAPSFLQPEIKKAYEEAKKRRIPFSETTNKEISPPPSQTGEELIKLYLRNGSYITVKITETTTIDNLCEKIIEKYGQKPGAGQYINIYERVKNSERRLGNRQEYVLEIIRKWPVILGPNGNETHLHCRLIVEPKPSAPMYLKDAFAKNVPEQK